MPELKGVITAMVSPFDAEGTLDLDAGRALARYLVDNGSHGVVVAGTTGESPTLSDDEKLALLGAVLEEIGGEATVIAGTGSNDTRHSAELTERAVAAGAHAALAVTPYYNKPNRAGLRAHFAAVAEAAGQAPVVLYNIPSRSVINMDPDLLAQIAVDNANVVAVKQAHDDDLAPIEGLAVLAGNDEVFLRTLELGGPGGILVASHIAGPQMRAIYDAFESGDAERARRIDDALRPVYAAMAVTANPIPVKTALGLRGVIEPNLRLPMVPASPSERSAVEGALEALDRLPDEVAA